jgi:hypothetical protein
MPINVVQSAQHWFRDDRRFPGGPRAARPESAVVPEIPQSLSSVHSFEALRERLIGAWKLVSYVEKPA